MAPPDQLAHAAPAGGQGLRRLIKLSRVVRSRPSAPGRLSAYWRGRSRLVDDDGTEVVHVGEGRARQTRSPSPRNIPSNCCRRDSGPDRGRAPGRGCSARVVDIGAGRDRRHAPPPPSVPSVSAASAVIPGRRPAPGERQRVFLVWAAAALPRMVTVSSPPDRITARLPGARRSPRQLGMCGRDFARLALDLVAEDPRLRSRPRRSSLRRQRSDRRAASPAHRPVSEGGVAGLRRLVGGSSSARATSAGSSSRIGRRSLARLRACVGSGRSAPEPITAGIVAGHVGLRRW